EVHIYTSDLDFFPVFEALQSTSCRGRLFFREGRVSDEPISCADSAEPIKVNWLLEACGIGWGHENSVFPPITTPNCDAEPFFVGLSTHGGPFEVRFVESTSSMEVSYFVNSALQCGVTNSALIVYALAEKFMLTPGNDLFGKISDLFVSEQSKLQGRAT
ncbi:MAG: hypothetical protein JWS10_2352, partial [Cypionkella sp.]|uniref:hypothetical protein n=1 Tax=Cypionkella sp. TaxID=2811411 RepID=UPI002625C716